MSARILPVLLVLPLLTILLAAESPEAQPVDGHAPEMQSDAPAPELDAKPKYKVRTVCHPVQETCYKEVAQTVTHIGPDGKPVQETVYRKVPYTVMRMVPETVMVPADAPPSEDQASEPAKAETPTGHSKALDEALARLRLYPKDAYLQFVVLQLARLEHCLDEIASEVEKAIGDPDREEREARRDSVDLFSIFTGALAVQESLQLNAMRQQKQLPTDLPPEPQARPTPITAVEEPTADESDELHDLENMGQPKQAAPLVATEVVPAGAPVPDPVPHKPWGVITGGPDPSAPPPPSPAPKVKQDYPPILDVAELHGPEIKSHPWKEMLAGRTPEIEPLAKMVPADFYYVHFKDLSKLLDVAELVDHIGTHFGNQAGHDARTQATAERLKQQLWLNDPQLMLLCKTAAAQFAVVGSDPFVHEGSDVTLLIRVNQRRVPPCWVEQCMPEGVLPNVPGTQRNTGEYRGVPYRHVESPDRMVCAYSAMPAVGLVIRSNSLAALKRIIDAINGHTPDGQPVTRLGDTDEFAYIRTLYPVSAEEEDGLIYLSDPFIRHLVGPQLKLTERRRMVCYNHLRMIGHAAMLFRSEHGRPPQSLDELYQAGCLPFPFHGEPSDAVKQAVWDLVFELNSDSTEGAEYASAELKKLGPVCKELLQLYVTEDLPLDVAMRIENVLAEMDDEPTCICPDDGCYHLSADGMSGVCDHHGTTHFLTPCLEHPVEKVYAAEAQLYDEFRNDYDQYWKTYFDPIAIRVQATPERYRMETIVLPLIDNSIYKGLSFVLGGQPANLDALPVPKRNIFSLAMRLNKEEWIKQLEAEEKGDVDEASETSEDEAAEASDEPASDNPPRKDSINGTIAELIKELGLSDKDIDLRNLDVEKFLKKGIGNQIGFHIYDAPPTFDFNASTALGQLMQLLGGHQTSSHSGEILEAFADFAEFFPLAGLLASFEAPVYLSIPVENIEIVDGFGDELERIFSVASRMANQMYKGWGGVEFYRMPFQNDPQRFIRVLAVQVGPVKFRGFWARIGQTVYIASQPCVLNDLLELENTAKPQAAKPQAEEVAHAMLKIRAKNWNEVLENTYLGWAENHRAACIENQGPLSSVAAAYTASLGRIDESERAQVAERIMKEAERLHGVRFVCPEGGHYILSPDGKQLTCSVHGSALEPRQPAELNGEGTIGEYLKQFGGLTASLSFLEDGLRAVLVIERK